MPRYDYRCTACGNEFELRQSFSEAGNGTCPLCSSAGQRLFHAVPVIYKGSGFYTTDYGRPKRQEDSSGKESADGDKSSSKAASSDKSDSSDKAASSDTSGKESSGAGSSSSGDTKAESSSKAATETSS